MKTILVPALMVIGLLTLPCHGQEAAIEFVRVKIPGFPHVNDSPQAGPGAEIRLTLAAQTGDDFYDGGGLDSQSELHLSGTVTETGATTETTRADLGRLKFVRPLPEGFHLEVYESTSPLKKGLLRRKDAELYSSTFAYKVLVFGADNRVINAWDLTDFFHPILEMNTADVVGPILYFDANYNGYSRITKEKTGYLVAFDVLKGEVLWTSPALTASYRGFVVFGDHIATGYGFTAEPDFLYLLNRHSGAVVQKERLNSAPERLAVKGNRVFVKCYEGSYVFEF